MVKQKANRKGIGNCFYLCNYVYLRLLGTLVLNLWDCGGQESFMENYYRSQRENIFRNVEVIHGPFKGNHEIIFTFFNYVILQFKLAFNLFKPELINLLYPYI